MIVLPFPFLSKFSHFNLHQLVPTWSNAR